MPPPEPRQLIGSSGGVRYSTTRNVCLAYYCGELRPEDIVRVTEVGLALGRSYPRGVVSFSCTTTGIALPSDEVRATASREMARVKHLNVCAATVVPGAGFWASAARSVITAINFLGRPGFPTRVFADTRTAAEWVAPYVVPTDGAVDAIVAALDALLAPGTS